jgi:hypothetical protein
MKRSSTNTALTHERCQYRTATGRQCASRVLDPASSYCPRHASYRPTDSQDFSVALTGTACRFLNAQGINYSLASLYHLLASGRISPRRASTLAYISSLLLRSLPAIDKDPCPDAGKDSESQDRLPKEVWQDDPWHRFPHLQRSAQCQAELQTMGLTKTKPQPDGLSQNSTTENPTSENATTQPATTPPVEAETMDAQHSKAPESDRQKTTPEKGRSASSTSTPAPSHDPLAVPPYAFGPQNVVGLRLAGRNSLLPPHLHNPNDPRPTLTESLPGENSAIQLACACDKLSPRRADRDPQIRTARAMKATSR